MDNYDEDLSENYWFSTFVTRHKKLYDTAASERSVICIPKVDSWTKEAHDTLPLQENKQIFETHILKECENTTETELNQNNQETTRWLSYNKKVLFIDGNTITCSKDFSGAKHSVVILFEENFFNDEDKSYKVICISSPLLVGLASKESQSHDIKLALPVIKTKRLYNISENVSNMRRLQSLMDHLISLHLKNTESKNLRSLKSSNSAGVLNIELDEMHALKNCLKSVTDLCNNCRQILMKDFKLKKTTEKNTQLLDIVRAEVELYVYYEIYGSVFRQICSYVADEEAKFNKTTQNIRNITPADVGISEDFWLSLPKAKRFLQRINRYFTVKEKLNCIKEACMCITSNKEIALSSDDLLPILVYLIIKCNIPNWLSNKVFIKNFNMLPNVLDQYGFYLCTFEAAIQHIKSGSVNKKNTPTMTDMLLTASADPFKDLNEAIANGDVLLLKERLEKGAKLKSQQDKKLCHPLCYCQKCSEFRKSNSAKINAQITTKTKNDKGQTLLHIAAENGHHEIVEFLLKFGFSVNETDYHGSSPLHVAAAAGAQSAMFLLLYHGANATAIDNNSNTALHLCCQNGHDACVKALLFFDPTSTAVNVNAPNDGGDTPLHIAAKWGYEDIVNVLMEYGADINALNRQKKTPLDVSHNSRVTRVLQNSANRVQLVLDLRHLQHENKCKSTTVSVEVPILSKSSSRDLKEAPLVSPSTKEKKINHAYAVKQVEKLLKAVTDNDINMVKFLCGWNEKKPKGEKASQAKCHPLCQCCKCQPNSHEHILHANSSNSENYCGLIIAAMHGYAEMSRIFLDHGADLNTTTKLHKYSALHFSAKSSNIEILDLLLSRGCKVDIRDDCGNTPLYMCCIYNHVNCADKLISFGASVNIRNRAGESPLHLAVKWKNKNVIELLVENGGMAYYKNHDGVTPVDISNANPEVKQVLLKSIVRRERSESELEWDIAPEQTNFLKECDTEDDGVMAKTKPLDLNNTSDKEETVENLLVEPESNEAVLNDTINKISGDILENSTAQTDLLQLDKNVNNANQQNNTSPALASVDEESVSKIEDKTSSPYFELGS